MSTPAVEGMHIASHACKGTSFLNITFLTVSRRMILQFDVPDEAEMPENVSLSLGQEERKTSDYFSQELTSQATSRWQRPEAAHALLFKTQLSR